MDNTIVLYIGSDNETLKISEEYKQKTLNILNKYLEGFTIENVVGFWGGNSEDTLKVTSFVDKVDKQKVKEICEDLKLNLKQKAIGVEFKKSNFQEL